MKYQVTTVSGFVLATITLKDDKFSTYNRARTRLQTKYGSAINMVKITN